MSMAPLPIDAYRAPSPRAPSPRGRGSRLGLDAIRVTPGRALACFALGAVLLAARPLMTASALAGEAANPPTAPETSRDAGAEATTAEGGEATGEPGGEREEDGADADRERTLQERSFPLREALYHDPTLVAPLERLVKLYNEAGRLEELLGLYRAHTAQYPTDAGGMIVLIRLELQAGRPEAAASARDAAARFPENAFLQYLLYRVESQTDGARALEALDRAVAHASDPTRKRDWVEALVPAAIAAGRRDLARQRLLELADARTPPATLLELSRLLGRHGFHADALALLERARSEADPEMRVVIALEAARAEVELGRTAAAAQRLDALLERLAPDYWRRAEVMRYRVALIQSAPERERILKAARTAWEKAPGNETAALDLAQLLTGFERRREAQAVLRKALTINPESVRLEKALLALLEDLRDPAAKERFLAQRLKRDPARVDLLRDRVRTLYGSMRHREARAALETLLAALPEAQRLATLLGMGRELREAGLLPEAAELLGRALERAPERLDLRRELAELYLAMRRYDRMDALFVDVDRTSAEAPVEILLDGLQFMVRERMYLPARRLLRTRLEKEAANLELRMQLLEIHRQLGDGAAGEALLAECRALADTDARYRLYLEHGVKFHEAFRTRKDFLNTEWRRLLIEQTGWDEGAVARLLALAEASARGGLKHEGAAYLQALLALDPARSRSPSGTPRGPTRPVTRTGTGAGPGGPTMAGTPPSMAPTEVSVAPILAERETPLPPPPNSARVRLRYKFLEMMAGDPRAREELGEQWRALARDDPSYQTASTVHLALLDSERGRHDLARQRLEGIDLNRLRNPKLLSRLDAFYRRIGDSERGVAVLDRLRRVDPTNREVWQRWLSALAARGEEERLRAAIRRLLVGVDRMPLSPGTQALLRAHLVDSYWRDIAAALAADTPGRLAESLVLLETVGRMHPGRAAMLWVAWTRAYVLKRLDRPAALAEATAELERLLAQEPGYGLSSGLSNAGAGAEAVAESEGDTGGAAPASTDPAADGADSPARTARTFEEGVAPPLAVERAAGIPFPDGLVLTPAGIRRALRTEGSTSSTSSNPPRTEATAPMAAQTAAHSAGPVGALRAGWVHDLDVPLRALHLLDEKLVLLLDEENGLHALEARSGKLRWWRSRDHEAIGPYLYAPEVAGLEEDPIYPQRHAYVYRHGHAMSRHHIVIQPGEEEPITPTPAAALTVAEGRIYLAAMGRVHCLNPKDGSVAWIATTADQLYEKRNPNQHGALHKAPRMLPDGERLLVFDPDASVVICLEAASGRLRWRKSCGAPVSGSEEFDPSPGWAGASLAGGALLVHGEETAILDAETGQTLWAFDATEPQPFPIPLNEKDGTARGRYDAYRLGGGTPSAPPAWAARAVGAPHSVGVRWGQQSGSPMSPPPGWQGYGQGSPWGYPSGGHPGHAAAMGPAGPMVRSYLGRTIGLSTGGGDKGGFAASAVVWANSPYRRLGRLTEHHALLMTDDLVIVTRLDLPLDAAIFVQGGLYLGRAGPVAAFLDGTGLTLIDSATLTQRRLVLSETERTGFAQGAVAGARVYVADTEGLLCINALTGARLFREPWPKPLDRYVFEPFTIQATTRTGQVLVDGEEEGGVILPLAMRVAGTRVVLPVAPTRVVSVHAANPLEGDRDGAAAPMVDEAATMDTEVAP